MARNKYTNHITSHNYLLAGNTEHILKLANSEMRIYDINVYEFENHPFLAQIFYKQCKVFSDKKWQCHLTHSQTHDPQLGGNGFWWGAVFGHRSTSVCPPYRDLYTLQSL